MIDTQTRPLTTAEAASHLHVHHRTLMRYILGGVATRTGRLRLPARKIGGRWMINPADMDKWVDTVTRDWLPPEVSADGAPPETRMDDTAAVRSPAQRRRDSERAGRELERMGC